MEVISPCFHEYDALIIESNIAIINIFTPVTIFPFELKNAFPASLIKNKRNKKKITFIISVEIPKGE
jgi:hypothetical protein